MLIWEYNNQFFLGINALKVKEAQVENGFEKYVPYIMGLIFKLWFSEKNGEQITGYSIFQINEILNANI